MASGFFTEKHGVAPPRHAVSEHHEKAALMRREPGFLDRPRRHDQLLAQGHVLREELLRRASQAGSRAARSGLAGGDRGQQVRCVDVAELSPEQRALWRRVELLWCMLGGDPEPIRNTLHPRYAGWVIGDELPHDREAGVRAAAAGPPLQHLHLEPKSVEIYGSTGVVHYTYRAVIGPSGGETQTVTGRWTEVYVDHDGTWLLAAVSGGPDRV